MDEGAAPAAAAVAIQCGVCCAQELFTTAYIGFLILISTSFVLYLVEKNGVGSKIHTYADALWCGIVCEPDAPRRAASTRTHLCFSDTHFYL